jgi:CheY-like chemotaxis protein
MTVNSILLVDDDQVCTFLLSKTLERLGYANKLNTAINGEEAIRLLTDNDQATRIFPDIIFLDLNMPVMDGFDFLDAYDKLEFSGKERTKIIIVTSSQDPDDIERTKKYGINAYLNKPIRPGDLNTLIN